MALDGVEAVDVAVEDTARQTRPQSSRSKKVGGCNVAPQELSRGHHSALRALSHKLTPKSNGVAPVTDVHSLPAKL